MSNRRTRTKRTANRFTRDHMIHLLTGRDFFNSAYGRRDIDWDSMRCDWDSRRDSVLVKWVRSEPIVMGYQARPLTGKPFTRPWAWWELDATEPRRCVHGIHPFDDPEFIARADQIREQHPGGLNLYRMSYGIPAYGGETNEIDYEPERDYLVRLNLLLAHEKKLLGNKQQ